MKELNKEITSRIEKMIELKRNLKTVDAEYNDKIFIEEEIQKALNNIDNLIDRLQHFFK